jgi:hypothetical protein
MKIQRKTTSKQEKEKALLARFKAKLKETYPGWPLPDDVIEDAVRNKWSLDEVKAFWGNIFIEHFCGNMTRTRESMKMAGWNPPGPEKLTELMQLESVDNWLKGGGVTRERRAGLATEFDIKLFWSQVLQNAREVKTFRFRASENLARAYGMFNDKLALSGSLDVSIKDALALLNQRTKG